MEYQEILRITKEVLNLSYLSTTQQNADMSNLNECTLLVNDLGFDSLSGIELIIDLEEKFKITIPEDCFDVIKTIGDLSKIIFLVINNHNQWQSEWMLYQAQKLKTDGIGLVTSGINDYFENVTWIKLTKKRLTNYC